MYLVYANTLFNFIFRSAPIWNSLPTSILVVVVYLISTLSPLQVEEIFWDRLFHQCISHESNAWRKRFWQQTIPTLSVAVFLLTFSALIVQWCTPNVHHPLTGNLPLPVSCVFFAIFNIFSESFSISRRLSVVKLLFHDMFYLFIYVYHDCI